MKLKLSGLLLLALGLSISSAQASKDYEPRGCNYDLRDGAFFFNANNRPTRENELLVFLRDSDGTLSADKLIANNTHRVKSGGYGNQAGIVTSGQNAVIHTGSGNRQYVLMINAGFKPARNDSESRSRSRKANKNGSVSVFKVNKCRVRLTDVKSTRGQEPRAVTRDTRGKGYYKRDLVYVVNAGSGEVAFNGCPGLPAPGEAFPGSAGFTAPTGIECGVRDPIAEEDQDPTSIIGYKFRRGKLRFIRGSHVETADEDGDPAQISFINEGRQVIVSQRATNFALGDGTEADNVEVFNLDKRGRPGDPVVSSTTGNDPFGFHIYPREGKDFNDCVMMSHGSFQQRDQGGVGVFTVNSGGSKVRIIPNKADGGSDTCWTAISRTNTLYTSAFFDSEISIRAINPDTCNLTDGGPPVVVDPSIGENGGPRFTGVVNPADLDSDAPGLVFAFGDAGYKHRVTSSAIFKGGDIFPPFDDCLTAPDCGQRGDDFSLVTDQTDFLYEAGGLDLSISKVGEEEYLYAIWAPVPFAIGTDDQGNFLWTGDVDAAPATTQVTVFRVVQECNAATQASSIYDDGCRVGDLELVQRVPGLPGSGYGAAAN